MSVRLEKLSIEMEDEYTLCLKIVGSFNCEGVAGMAGAERSMVRWKMEYAQSLVVSPWP
jgi:hypothetical protein